MVILFLVPGNSGCIIMQIIYCFQILLLQEVQRSTLIKDTMRVQCVNDLVEAWYKILVSQFKKDLNVSRMHLEFKRRMR